MPSPPVAIASAVTRKDQVLRHCNLGSLAATIASVDLTGPVVIGVGRAFAGKTRQLTEIGSAHKQETAA